MVEQAGGLDGRALTKNVIADFCTGWRAVWLDAIDLRDKNPDIFHRAMRAPADDPEASIRGLVPHLALLHPTVATSVVALLDLVIEEAQDEAVSPPRDDPDGTEQEFDGDGDRNVEQDVGGQRQQDRLVQDLQDEVAELRGRVDQWERVFGVVGDLLAVRADRSLSERRTAES